jgi:membrane-associated phospholipid phosphatase
MELTKRMLAVTFVLPLLIATASSQSPYAFNWKRETAITALGISAWGGSLPLGQSVPVFTREEVLGLDRDQVNGFDRIATYQYSTGAQEASDLLRWTSRLMPVVLLADRNMRGDAAVLAMLAAQTMVVNNGITSLTKSGFGRTRPYVYNELVSVDDKLTPGAKRSFISGHTSNTAAMSFFTAKVFADYHPDSKWRPFVWAAAAVLPAATGYMRVKAGKHYPTDVLAGYAVGALSGYLVPQLHKVVRNRPDRRKDLDLQMGITGASLRYQF